MDPHHQHYLKTLKELGETLINYTTTANISEPIQLDLSGISSFWASGSYIAWLLTSVSVMVDAITRTTEARTNSLRLQHGPQTENDTYISQAHRLFRKISPLDPNALFVITYPTIAAICVFQKRHVLKAISKGDAHSPDANYKLEDVVYLIELLFLCRIASFVLLLCLVISVICGERSSAESVIATESSGASSDSNTTRNFWSRISRLKQLDLGFYLFFVSTVLAGLARELTPTSKNTYLVLRKMVGLNPFDWGISSSATAEDNISVFKIYSIQTNIPWNHIQSICEFGAFYCCTYKEWLFILAFLSTMNLLEICIGGSTESTAVSKYFFPAWPLRVWRLGLRLASTRAARYKFISALVFIGLSSLSCWVFLLYINFRVYSEIILVAAMFAPTVFRHDKYPFPRTITAAKFSDLDQVVAVVMGAVVLFWSLLHCSASFREWVKWKKRTHGPTNLGPAAGPGTRLEDRLNRWSPIILFYATVTVVVIALFTN